MVGLQPYIISQCASAHAIMRACVCVICVWFVHVAHSNYNIAILVSSHAV